MFTRTTAKERADPTPSPESARDRRVKRILAFTPPLVALLTIALIWRFGDLRAFDSPQRFAELAGSLREHPLGPLYALLAIGLGTLVFLPVTPLVLGITFAFDPLHGFVYACLGVLFAASLTYGAGRLFGGAAVARLSGPRLSKLARELRANAFRAAIVMRLLPVGHFTVLNMLAGSLRVPFVPFFFGNIVGIVPAIAFATLFAERVWHAVRSGDPGEIALLVAGVLLIGGVVFGLSRLRRRRAQPADSEEA